MDLKSVKDEDIREQAENQMEKILEKESGLVEKDRKTYSTTPKGKEVVKGLDPIYRNITNYMSSKLAEYMKQ
tara:strand:- start:166 stop:381 length:216 start_codon:yes stop_codon:yes gene_type:complete